MFEDIGGKLKGFAKILLVIGILASIISGLSLTSINGALGVILIVMGSISSLAYNFFMYGFSELVDHTIAIYNELHYKTQKQERKEAIAYREETFAGSTECKHCGYKFKSGRSSCPSCERKQ